MTGPRRIDPAPVACPACHRENRPDARFCMGCGTPIERRCDGCDRPLPADAAYCDGCGRAIAPPATAPAPEASARDPRVYTPQHLARRILTSRGALEGERKHVTVLFADLAGFTSLSESRDPEEMHALMDRFFQLVLNEVHRYEGTVNQFLGDGAMALFGAPVALEDAPRRAVAAALAIQRGLAALREESASQRGAALVLRIGIHSGHVVVGRIGDDLRMDYTAVGDTTNLAARLQALAPPGDILISETTQRSVAGFFELEDLGPQSVRGKAEPVRAFRVVAERRVSGRIDSVAASGLTPLVGRERELGDLQAAFEAAREGRGRACFLVGDAGIGKSRLLYELRSRLADEPHTWFEGRCASFGSATAFQPVVDGLQRAFDIDDRDDEAAALAKLERGVALHGADLVWTLPFLQRLLSLPASDPAVDALDAVTRRSETIRALHALFLRIAERMPLVFVVEDLHWIDAASEEFLDFLVDSIPAARVCVLLTHRAGYRQPFGDRSYHVRVALQSLSRSEMAAMAGALLDATDLPAELRELIAKKAEGNPFFVEEVTRSLLEEGVLRQEGGRVALVRDLSEISVPDSIHDVLMARIDRLDEEPKRAIQVASVIGREFALRLLERIVEAGETVHAVVGELRSLELIYQKAAHPELAFMFKHALTHDVAYESVLRQRRKALHRIVGSAIEELYADRLAEHYEALAHHFARGDEWGRALFYHDRAAQKARDAYANRSAAEHFKRALAIAERLGDAVPPEHRRRLAQGLGDVCYFVNEFRASGDAYAQAAEWSDGDEGRAMNLGRAAHSYLWGHHYERAAEAWKAALPLARACGSEAAEAIALTARGHLDTTHHGLSELVADGEGGAAVSRIALRSGDDEAIATAMGQEGLWAELQGDYRHALAVSERALASGQRTQLTQLVAIPRWTIGLSLTCLGEYGGAIAELSSTLDFCNRIGDRAFKARILNTLGWCFAEIGCHRRASELNREARDIAAELVELDLVAGAPEIHANATINLACNRVALGDAEGALELVDPIRVDLETPGDPWQRWRYSLHVQDATARALLAQGDPERAGRLASEELAGARRQRSKKLEARALELRARALLTLDRREETQRVLGDALAVARGIGYPPGVWRSLSLQAELARRCGDASAAERLGSESKGLVTRLAGSLPETALRDEFGALAERLVSDPLAAYR
jgi:class 3 adenylate cyclase/tetratricopeptide (TPR) repeat protein